MNFKTLTLSRFSLLLAVIFAFSGCKKDDTDDGGSGNGSSGSGNAGALSSHVYLSGDLISADFRGLILDENGAGVSNVAVSVGMQTVYTDDTGLWQILGAMVDSERAYVRAEKDGYFHGSRVLTPNTSGFNRAFITLMTAETTGTVSAADGGEVSHSSGSMVVLPADGYVDAMGNTYSGTVNVQMTYLDPSSDEIFTQMPGNLTALESDNDFVALKTYGMIGVELVGAGGEELQIAPGSNAEIHVPVPAVGLSGAPETIPLWHFNEEAGIWEEDGTASLVGNEYVGTVSHFSFWNCDVPNDYIFLDGYVLGDEGAFPVQGVLITLITDGFGSGSAYSGVDGYFGGMVPTGAVFTMTVTSPCGEVISSQEIGPFNSDVTVPNVIFLESNGLGYITGTLNDCGGEPGEGYVTIEYDGGFPESVEVAFDGSFTIAMACAPQEVTLTGYASNYLSNSGDITVSTLVGETVDVGTVDLCAVATDEYIIVTVNGTTLTIVDSLGIWSNGAYIGISGSQYLQNDYSEISFNFVEGANPTASDFDAGQSNYFYLNNEELYGFLESPSDMDWNFTSYGTNVGDYLEFTFSGTYEVNGANGLTFGLINVSGSGRIQRD